MGSIPITRSIFQRRPFGFISVVLGVLLLLLPAQAATVLQTEVTHKDGRYTVTFEFGVAADANAVRRVLTDYDHLDRLSRVVQKSEQLSPGDDGRPRVRVVMHSCFLFFCQTVRKLETVTEFPDGRLVVIADPAESDYRYSRVEWQIHAERTQTRITYQAEHEPAFFVPPLIGPWVVKMRIRHELELMAERLEQLAQTPAERAP
ncbi:MAG: SRPBCC family protein [Gammaproteobacteria bacterium]|nr:SRPBCC family protein [Gammaproteobacteria bacterium]